MATEILRSHAYEEITDGIRLAVTARLLLGTPRLGIVHPQPGRPAADPHNGRGAVGLLYAEIMRASDPGAR